MISTLINLDNISGLGNFNNVYVLSPPSTNTNKRTRHQEKAIDLRCPYNRKEKAVNKAQTHNFSTNTTNSKNTTGFQGVHFSEIF